MGGSLRRRDDDDDDDGRRKSPRFLERKKKTAAKIFSVRGKEERRRRRFPHFEEGEENYDDVGQRFRTKRWPTFCSLVWILELRLTEDPSP